MPKLKSWLSLISSFPLRPNQAKDLNALRSMKSFTAATRITNVTQSPNKIENFIKSLCNLIFKNFFFEHQMLHFTCCYLVFWEFMLLIQFKFDLDSKVFCVFEFQNLTWILYQINSVATKRQARSAGTKMVFRLWIAIFDSTIPRRQKAMDVPRLWQVFKSRILILSMTGFVNRQVTTLQ
jgi:hypothetical protein